MPFLGRNARSGMRVMPWQPVINGRPGDVRLHPHMHLRRLDITLVDRTEGHASEGRNIRGLVPERRTARAAKNPKPTA
jgi:hypothetical protein